MPGIMQKSGKQTYFRVLLNLILFETRREKTGLWEFRSGLTQTGMYSARRRLEACNFGYK